MPGPLLTQVAESVPFEESRSPDANGLTSDITADNVQDAIEQAQPTIQQNGTDVGRVGKLNFTGTGIAVSNTGDYNVTVAVSGAVPLAREAIQNMYSFGPINEKSGLIFEADPINDTIHFLTQQDM